MKKIQIIAIICLSISCRNNTIDKLSNKYNDSLKIDSIGYNYADSLNYFYLNVKDDDTLPKIFNILIEDIYEYSNTTDSRTKTLYSTILSNIDSLIKLDIPNKNNLLTEIYNYCEYSELEGISKYIVLRNGVIINESSNKKDIIINSDDWKFFKGYLGTTKSGKILNPSFVKFTTIPNVVHYNITYGMDVFMGTSYKKQSYYVSDTMIAIMPNRGFESIKYVISIWRVINDKYKLITVLDSCMEIAIGGYWIEDIVSFDINKKIIIGRSMGGDEGHSWGSIWIGIWEKPRKFRIIYELGWSGEEFGANPYIENLNYRIDRSNLKFIIEKSRKNFKWENNSKNIIDSTLSRIIVDISTLMD
jgi:hypothetical protein